jgi:hypothetical protein
MNLKMNIKNLIKMKALSVAIATICMSFFLYTGCQEEEKSGGGAVHDPSQPVIVTSFKPDTGRISEMVLLDGANFGTDTSKLRVYFNTKRADIIGSTGTRILALVPRLPGDTCILSVEAGGKKATYPNFFRYKVEASASTFAGVGGGGEVFGTLDDAWFKAVYLTVDKDDNLFAAIEDKGGMLLKISEKENSVTVLATAEQGMSARFQLSTDPVTGVIMMGAELGGTDLDRFLFCDPEDGYAPRYHYIREWVLNGYREPNQYDEKDERSKNGNVDLGGSYYPEAHYHCLLNKIDGYYYTRYATGHLVKIHPTTWVAEIVGMTFYGPAYGMAFHPIRHNELWIAYAGGAGGNAIYTLDVTDPNGTFRKVSGSLYGGTATNVKLSDATFAQIRQISFDADGNLFVCDAANHCIRRVDTETMRTEIVLGIPGQSGYVNGKKEDAQFSAPYGIAVNSEGIVFVADYNNECIRRIAIE